MRGLKLRISEERWQIAHPASQPANKTVTQVGKDAIADSVTALDERARNDIERLTTDIARQLSCFLYDRDADVLLASENRTQ